MRDFSQDHRWLSINTATVRKSRGVDLPLPQIIEACVQRRIRAISPWRDQVAAAGLETISNLVKAHGLELSGYCRGGMFPAVDAKGLAAARDDNRRAVDEACELNAKCLVLVVGGLPGALAGKAAHKDIALSRNQVRDGIAELLD
jgi:sugar phosphate isomerase/epimerase